MPDPVSAGPRLVSLKDGRVFPLGAGPAIIGRHSTSDIQLQGPTVSRRHAEIRPTPEGHTLADFSVNGTLLNGQPVVETRILLPGDLIRVGDHELRFEKTSGSASPLPVPASRPPGSPILPVDDQPLATLTVTSGRLKGKVYPLHDTVVDIGRAAGNGIVFREEGVSTEHARLALRGTTWYLKDHGSTNGTFLDRERIRGERPVPAGAVLNFGDVAASFEPASEDVLAEASARPRRRSTGKSVLVAELPGGGAGKLRQWIRRYGVAEVIGTLTAFFGSYSVDALTHNPIAAAYGGSVGESLGFYLTIIVRELVHDAYEAGTERKPYGLRESLSTARNILVEFGFGELIDTGLFRPLCMGLGTAYLGRELGIVAGKMASDIIFYLPVILMYEFRKKSARR